MTDWKPTDDEIETLFANYSLQQPSEWVLERVRAEAAKQVKPGFWTLLQKRFPLPMPRSLAWATTVVVIACLTILVSQTGTLKTHTPTNQGATTIATPPTQTRAPIATPVTQGTGAAVIDQQIALDDYTQALKFFNEHRFAEALHLFQQIDTTHPDFTKKSEMLSYWIVALERTNQHDLAQKKKAELNSLRISTPNL